MPGWHRSSFVALLLLALALPAVALAGRGGDDPCAPRRSGEQCGPGGGRQTVGGGEKVSHKGWPAITGIFFKVTDNSGHHKAGGPDNDELLGHHGSDRLSAATGTTSWGDWDPRGNSTGQHDVLRGGDGNDLIYPSHGATRSSAAGQGLRLGVLRAWVIDCGPGKDTVRIRLGGAFKTRSCEVVDRFCAYGSNGHGGCKKPGRLSVPAVRPRAGA